MFAQEGALPWILHIILLVPLLLIHKASHCRGWIWNLVSVCNRSPIQTMWSKSGHGKILRSLLQSKVWESGMPALGLATPWRLSHSVISAHLFYSLSLKSCFSFSHGLKRRLTFLQTRSSKKDWLSFPGSTLPQKKLVLAHLVWSPHPYTSPSHFSGRLKF